MFSKIIEGLSTLELANKKARVKVVLHTSVLRFPMEELENLLLRCKEHRIELLLPVAYFYEVSLLMESELLGDKAKTLLRDFRDNVKLMEHSIEDFYVACEENNKLSSYHDLLVFLFGDELKLEECIKFIHNSDFHMMILLSDDGKPSKAVSIYEAKAFWKDIAFYPCECKEAIENSVLEQRAKSDIFAESTGYIHLDEMLYEGGEAQIFSVKARKNQKKLAKLYRYLVATERKEKLERLLKASAFFQNVVNLEGFLMKKGASEIWGILMERLEDMKPLSAYLHGTSEFTGDMAQVFRKLLLSILELNMFQIYFSDLDGNNILINERNNDIRIIDFDGCQIGKYTSGTKPKVNYVHPLYTENLKRDNNATYYPMYQNYAFAILLIKWLVLGEYIPDNVLALRRRDGLFQNGTIPQSIDCCEREWEDFARQWDYKDFSDVFYNIFCKGYQVPLGYFVKILGQEE